MSMRVEKSTAEQVRNRLEEVKKAKQGGGGGSGADYAPDGERPRPGGELRDKRGARVMGHGLLALLHWRSADVAEL
jgi:hypothetical protein